MSRIFKLSLSVAFGYLPLGATFGVLLVEQGYHWILSSLMGVFVFAGAAQFLALAMLKLGSSPLEAFGAASILNLRHLFYGIAMRESFEKLGGWKAYLAFALTDETYSILSSSKNLEKMEIVRLSMLNHFWWSLGCTAGALLGPYLPFSSNGMEFALTALFVVLLMESLKCRESLFSAIVATLSFLAVAPFVSTSTSMLLAIGSALGLMSLWEGRRFAV